MNGTTAFPAEWADLDVVLSHDWLTGMRGGERVLELLCRAFPRAPIYTLFHDPSSISGAINSHPVRTSVLQHVPGIRRHYRKFLPLFPFAAGSLKPPECDLLLSASHCTAKSLRAPGRTRHLCYCFTPMRYAWMFREEYIGNPLARVAAGPVLSMLRRWDRRTATRVNRFVAISRHVQSRIRSFYGRGSDVVHPPVDTQFWTPGPGRRENFDLVASALVPYKRIDLAVRAYTKSGHALRIAGTGPDRARLQSVAGPTVEFMGRVSDGELLGLYRSCRQLVFPGEEDFGLVPLEAQACGTPVVAYGRGGATETVEDGVTGTFFAEQTEDALADAVARSGDAVWDAAVIRAHAARFDVSAFVAGLRNCVSLALAGNDDTAPARPME